MKRSTGIILAICIMILCTACGDNQKQVQVSSGSNESLVNIYYPGEKEVLTAEEQYQIKLPDSVSSSVEEVMTALMQNIDQKLVYHTYMLDVDNNLSLEFEADGEMTQEEMILTDASICQTLFQIDGINNITIKILNIEGKTIRENLYMRDSFYFYEYDEASMNERKIMLYYANKTGDGLVSTEVSVVDEANVSMEEKIVQLLVSRGCLPQKTVVNSVGFSSGICYLDLNRQFMGSVSGVKGETALYGLVNSIVSLPDVDKVQLLVEGEIIHLYRGVSGVDEPLQFNDSILE